MTSRVCKNIKKLVTTTMQACETVTTKLLSRLRTCLNLFGEKLRLSFCVSYVKIAAHKTYVRGVSLAHTFCGYLALVQISNLRSILFRIKALVRIFFSSSRVSHVLKFSRLFALEFISTFLIVGCTREYVSTQYIKTAVFEAAWITQWFYQAKLFNEQEETRSWTLGYPAFLIGTILGAWAGMWVT